MLLCLLCACSSHCEASCIVISEEGEDQSPGNEGEELKVEVTLFVIRVSYFSTISVIVSCMLTTIV